MVKLKTVIKKFASKGEKTGWSYVEVNSTQANKIKKDYKRSYKVKGKLDLIEVENLAMIPMGGGAFIIPLKADMRKKLGKEKGDAIVMQLEEDTKKYQLDKELLICLKEEPVAYTNFKALPMSHQNYYSKWVESAKTDSTKAKRIGLTINGMLNKWTFAEILKNARDSKRQ